ncbi:Beta-lactamase domain-containing protein 2-like protein 2 [Colletotrichum chlorophyti]|uniref:Beta-lactamase domain-containing protein 2-like protein 2 n=1 Tax=Colletotrichum chlorophyti TaxID=708187 RepID=A0A1Q8RWT2_9PEZI|nr:Beta-lactamase domain-containing protein 2-like protein 2 [Colletotrichum chlorophyti]
MAPPHGTYDSMFQGVYDSFQQLLESGQELGASLTVNIDGRDVVDLWGGYADTARNRPWNENTIVNVWSTTKTISALAVLLLIEEGQLSPNDEISRYWPEFAVNGKKDIQVRHLLSHNSGIAIFEEPLAFKDLCDRQFIVSKLEKQLIQWQPGTASGYHCWTYGYLIGELVRRKTGLSLTDFVSRKIAGPLHADFQIGAKEEDWARIAEMVPPQIRLASDSKFETNPLQAGIFNPFPNVDFTNTSLWRRAEIGSGNGHTNSKALARIWSRAITITDNRQRLLSKKTIDLIFEEQSYGPDLCLGFPVRFGIGMGIRGNGNTPVDSWLPEGRICYWGGWGGSMVVNDVDRHITIAYTMNKMENTSTGNKAFRRYAKEIYRALGVSVSCAPTVNSLL